MRRVPYVGVYGVTRPAHVPLAATCGNVLVGISPVTLLHEPGLIEAIRGFEHLRVIPQIHIVDEMWRDDPGFVWEQLDHIREGLRLHGMLHRVPAILVDEECMTTAYADRPGVPATQRSYWWVGGDAASPDPIARINWCHRRWSDAVARTQAAFTRAQTGLDQDIYVGAVETLWHDGHAYGPAYYRPVLTGCDFLGLDAYVAGPVTRAAFASQVQPIFDHAATLGKPLLIVGQGFADALRQMPEPHQLRWWLDHAPPQTQALAWFTLYAPDDPGDLRALATTDAQLAAVQWYARICGAVPR